MTMKSYGFDLFDLCFVLSRSLLIFPFHFRDSKNTRLIGLVRLFQLSFNQFFLKFNWQTFRFHFSPFDVNESAESSAINKSIAETAVFSAVTRVTMAGKSSKQRCNIWFNWIKNIKFRRERNFDIGFYFILCCKRALEWKFITFIMIYDTLCHFKLVFSSDTFTRCDCFRWLVNIEFDKLLYSNWEYSW